LDGRLIAVGDGSKDSTGVILDRLAEKEPRLLVHHQQNAGHGAAILAGYRMAIIHCCYLIQPSRHGLKHLFRCALG
jgi:glycosyltransferase involved in cell wall biosynthesis